uniref:HMG box domain-containing protein n=1 Tax=Panagrolaimus superbus TaxID=310955 RepID=A0A914Z5Y0_9BILA
MREDKPPIRGKTSPYGFFVKMCYEEHKKKYPDESVQVTEISKKCADKWKTMTEDEKRRFYELASKDADRYQAEVAAYGGEDNSKKKKRAKRDPNAPKRALSAFFFFSNERRQSVQQVHPEWKVSQVAQELGKVWKDMTPEEKGVYEKKANDDKARYAEDMKIYRETQVPGSISSPQQGNSQQRNTSGSHQQQDNRHVQSVPSHSIIQQHPHQQVIMVQQPGGHPQQIMMVPQHHIEYNDL